MSDYTSELARVEFTEACWRSRSFFQRYKKVGVICDESASGNVLKVRELTKKGDIKLDRRPLIAKWISYNMKQPTQKFGGMLACPLEVAAGLTMTHMKIPHVVKYHDWIPCDQGIILITEEAGKIDLRSYLNECQNEMDLELARIFFRQLATALLIMLEDCQYIHFDLKPENLVIDPDAGELTIIDFGLLRKAPYIVTGITGTALYTPPEAIEGYYTGGEQVTVFQIGTILYEMTAKKGKSTACHYDSKGILCPFSTLEEIVSKELDLSPLDDDQELRHLVASCLEKDPEKRIGLRKIVEHPWLVGRT